MLTAAGLGLLAGSALLLGGLIGSLVRVPPRVVGAVMAFGAGVLISAVAFELTLESHEAAGAAPVVLGLIGGALTFFVGDWLVDRHGAHRRKSPVALPHHSSASATALVLGALLDGIPESAAIGAGLASGSEIGVAFVAAVFLSNVPESMGASAGLKDSGWSLGKILGLWGLVCLASAAAAAIGHAALGGAGPQATALVQSFAAGAIITMLADTMMPEAMEHSGKLAGLLTAAGFLAAFLLSHA